MRRLVKFVGVICLFVLNPAFAISWWTVGVDYYITNSTQKKISVVLDDVDSYPDPYSDTIDKASFKKIIELAPSEKKKLGRIEYHYDYDKNNTKLLLTVNQEPSPLQCRYSIDVVANVGPIHVAHIKNVTNEGESKKDKYACDLVTRDKIYSAMGDKARNFQPTEKPFVELSVVLVEPLEDIVPVCKDNVFIDTRSTRNNDISLPSDVTVCPGGTITVQLIPNTQYYNMSMYFQKPMKAKANAASVSLSASQDVVGWILQNSVCNYQSSSCRIDVGSGVNNIMTGASAVMTFKNTNDEDIQPVRFTSQAP